MHFEQRAQTSITEQLHEIFLSPHTRTHARTHIHTPAHAPFVFFIPLSYSWQTTSVLTGAVAAERR